MHAKPQRATMIFGAVLALTLFILAGTIGIGAWTLRQRVHAQMLMREAELLNGVAQMQYLANDVPEPRADEPVDPLDHLTTILKISRLPHKGVLGVRIFDANGKSVAAFPAHLNEGELSAEAVATAQTQAASNYHPDARWRDYFIIAPQTNGETIPLLEVVIPLRRNPQAKLVGIAQFILEGESIKREFANVDRGIMRQSVIALIASSAIIIAGLTWAFRRLRHANELLEERTASLLRANHELTLAAKTSAVGAVTSHLIHGLRNPLSGLQQFVSNLDQGGGAEGDVKDAVATTRRMQSLISEVVRVLQEEKGGANYEVSIVEIAEILESKMRPVATRAGIKLSIQVGASGQLTNKDANLILLILENLLSNAIQATPTDKQINLSIESKDSGILFTVNDQGSGLPETVRVALFTPCQSTKAGGAGIGLAISHQLARQLNAELRLASTGPSGTSFQLHLSHSAMQEKRDLNLN